MMFLFLGLGILFGGIINFLTYRIPNEIPLFRFQNICPHCHSKRPFYVYIPIVGYLVQRGTYQCCQKPVLIDELWIPVLNGLLWMSAYLVCIYFYKDTNIYRSLIFMAICSTLLIVFFVDLRHMIIPDRCHIILILLAIMMMIFEFIDWKYALISGFVMGLVFLLIAFTAEKILKKEALGGGDIKLMAAAGFLIGGFACVLALMIGSLLGLIVEGLKIAFNKKESGTYLAFGPYLVIGIIIALFFGDTIINLYLDLFY